jgi:2-oxoglutarate dehydrogenase E2 component (dihydrolipoamide succinyltransferase)
MASEIKIPSVGESVSEVTIGKWMRAEGESVKKDEIILALETDKVNVEVPAPEDGVLRGVSKKEGESARIGEVVARVEAGQGVAPAANPAAPQDAPAQVSETGKVVPPNPDAPSAAPSGDQRVMPAAQRMLVTDNVDVKTVTATGPGGRMLKEDVQRAAAGTPAKTPAAPAASAPKLSADNGELTKIVPMSALRRRVAERLVSAQQNAAILTTFNEVDMSYVMATRKKFQEQFVARYGIKLGFMSFFIKAAIDALRAFPEINAEIRGTDIVYRNYYDVGVAVGSAKGLFVPVVRRAELLSFSELEQTIADYGKRAQAGKLTLDEMTGGTFTISNGGVYGSLMSTPILNPPQSGILGMHSIVERPVGVAGKIELRPMMYLALSYDHRIVDGKGAVSFLKRVKECIESPERMLLEI